MPQSTIRGVVLLICGIILIVFSVVTMPYSHIEETVLLVAAMVGVGLIVVGVQWMNDHPCVSHDDHPDEGGNGE